MPICRETSRLASTIPLATSCSTFVVVGIVTLATLVLSRVCIFCRSGFRSGNDTGAVPMTWGYAVDVVSTVVRTGRTCPASTFKNVASGPTGSTRKKPVLVTRRGVSGGQGSRPGSRRTLLYTTSGLLASSDETRQGMPCGSVLYAKQPCTFLTTGDRLRLKSPVQDIPCHVTLTTNVSTP